MSKRVRSQSTRRRNESGVSLIELMVTVLLLTVIGAAATASTITYLHARKRAMNDSLALQLAQERIEEFAAVDPVRFSDGDSWTEIETRLGLAFTRVSTISLNADNSRTVVVQVSPNQETDGGSATISASFVPWELSS